MSLSEHKLRVAVGSSMVVSHILVIAYITVLYSKGGFLLSEYMLAISIILPLFASYTTIIIQYISSTRLTKVDKSKPVSIPFSALSFIVPMSFFIFICIAAYLKAYNIVITTFDEFARFLAIMESAIGIYVGQLLYSLFVRDRP